MTNRLPLDPPKQWGLTDDELATQSLAFRDDVLAGKVCVVSGGGSGMGRAIAYVLARLGAEVIICGRRADKLEETAAGIAQRLGKTIIISSHILSELQTLCNRVAIIEKGKLIYSGPVQGVRDQMSQGRVIWVRVSSDQGQAVELLKTRPEIREVGTLDGEIKVTLTSHEVDHSIVADVLVRGGAKLIELREDEMGLEEVFMQVTRGETQ
jgi:hypothetical protein